jgi:hypothetical protein
MAAAALKKNSTSLVFFFFLPQAMHEHDIEQHGLV